MTCLGPLHTFEPLPSPLANASTFFIEIVVVVFPILKFIPRLAIIANVKIVAAISNFSYSFLLKFFYSFHAHSCSLEQFKNDVHLFPIKTLSSLHLLTFLGEGRRQSGTVSQGSS